MGANRYIEGFFFSNYFYGICAVALTIEATLQQGMTFNSVHYYLFIFACVVLYYTRAYITERKTATTNPRTRWYQEHRRAVIVSQAALTLIVISYAAPFVTRLPALAAADWLAIFIFPGIAVFYYGINHEGLKRYRLRNIGWLKPFVIGFVWAGIVNVYPIIFNKAEAGNIHRPDLTVLFLFIKNFMFITVLCIIFDIKDYAADHNRQLKTFVVKAGLRKTIFRIIIPLCIAGLISFLCYAMLRTFSFPKILINTVPFLLLIVTAYSLHRRKSILYYLVVIDGLMLIKAICGSLAMVYF